MACIPCLVTPFICGSSIMAFLNNNKLIITISVCILVISLYLYMKYKNCKKCQK